jgi:hypothetical protein
LGPTDRVAFAAIHESKAIIDDFSDHISVALDLPGDGSEPGQALEKWGAHVAQIVLAASVERLHLRRVA